MKKVNIIMRALPNDKWESRKFTKNDIVICDCGYIELRDDQTPENTDIWDLCNWGCWSRDYNEENDVEVTIVPDECKNLKIDHCNSDMAYEYEGKWYSHKNTLEGDLNSCVEHMRSKLYGKIYDALWPIPSSVKVMDI